MIRITAKKDGFRRGGVAHPGTATEYRDDRFSKEELESLMKEPMLVVEVIKGESAVTPAVKPNNNLTARPNVAATIELLKAAKSTEEIDKFLEGEDRAGVLKEVEAIRSALQGPPGDQE